ncbi:MAG TPA: signal recognition particle protein, partial [Planctomycetes bacterium]|nr:signal recognition particle protein [Planctomycetota bacterium]
MLVMLDNLSKSFQDVLGKFRRTGKLTEADIKEGTREVRRALLEADVHFKVAKDFANKVGEQLLEQAKLDGVSGGQQVVAAFHKQLTELMSHELPELPKNPGHPMVLLLAGLQGAGKTTTAAKLALHMRKTQNRKVLMAACDLQRPGAVDQLQTLGKQLEIEVYAEDPKASTPEKVAANALKHAKKGGFDALIVDSAGRLHIDHDLMDEIKRVSDRVRPDATYLVLDSMTGQDAVESAQTFANTLELYGLILTKIDGDTRGGAALSVTQITGKPICFLGTGEKPSEFEKFDAERVAGRILDMGDIVGLVETAQDAFDDKQAEVDYSRMMEGKFTMQELTNMPVMMLRTGHRLLARQ